MLTTYNCLCMYFCVCVCVHVCMCVCVFSGHGGDVDDVQRDRHDIDHADARPLQGYICFFMRTSTILFYARPQQQYKFSSVLAVLAVVANTALLQPTLLAVLAVVANKESSVGHSSLIVNALG